MLALAFSAGIGLPIAAQADGWLGTNSSDWFAWGNWNSLNVPTGTSQVYIDTNAPNATVIATGNANANTIDIGTSANVTAGLTISNGGTLASTSGNMGAGLGSVSTVTITGAGSAWNNLFGLFVGENGTSTINILNGGVLAAQSATLGAYSGSVGTINVDGAGSSWTNINNIAIGANGNGWLEVTNGGSVSAASTTFGYFNGSFGIGIVDGVGSALAAAGRLNVGLSGYGDLAISGGGQVTADETYIGVALGGIGSVFVDGAGSSLSNTGILVVGYQGDGTLDISNGGAVSNTGGIIGAQAGSFGTATVDGAGSVWTNSGALAVGEAGTGTLYILNGGAVSNTFGRVGDAAGSTGNVTVDGAGSVWTNASTLTIGNYDTGTLSILNGGHVTNTFSTVGFEEGAVGSVLVDGAGSTWADAGTTGIGHAGVGALVVSNGGSVSSASAILGYYSTATGTATVDGVGSTWASTGDLTVGINGTGTLTVSAGGAVTAGGDIRIADLAGSTGVVNIGGAVGAAAAGAGTLGASSILFGAGAGTLNFNHTGANYLFATAFDADGTINQTAGHTNLTGNSAGFTGQVNVNGGWLSVNGDLSQASVLVAGGILGGNGTVGTTTVQAGGTLAPGNSIGTITVAGNLVQAAGSVYDVELTSAGASDLIDVTGTATIAAGAALNLIQMDAGPYVIGTQYTVLQAAGGVSGEYTIPGGVFGNFTASYDATHAYLNYQAASTFASVALTPNQIATAGGATQLGAGNQIYDAILNSGTKAEAQFAFDQLSGEIHASAKTALIDDTRFVREAAFGRLRAGQDGGKTVWASAFGAMGQSNSDGNAAKMTSTTGGIFLGADVVLDNGTQVGVLGGIGQSSFAVDDRRSTGSSKDYYLGVYGGHDWGDLSFKGGLAYATHALAIDRRAAFPGFTDSLSSGYNSNTTQVFGELAYKLPGNALNLEPFANLTYVHLASDGFSETGGAAALTGKSGSSDLGFATLGARASRDVSLGNGTVMKAHGMLGWRQAFGDTTPLTNMSFAGGTGFDIAGVPASRGTVLVEAGLDFDLGNQSTLSTFYSGQFSNGAADHSISAVFAVKF